MEQPESEMDLDQKWRPPNPSALEKRHSDLAMPALLLVELDPATIVDGVRSDGAYATGDISTSGRVRETCPACDGVHLQLVLRQKNVYAEHLFCPQCTRCFDACLADGASALKT
jgi:NAD-dependent dihydropyrimidine dehydrogenase PreA subunit